nr:MAG TPA: hypothetical protein [Caudoviricetes sp.]
MLILKNNLQPPLQPCIKISKYFVFILKYIEN